MKFKGNYLLYFIILLVVPMNVLASSYSYRRKEINVIYILSVALLIIRIVVPILLIVVGMIGLMKAMLQNSDADITKELKKLVPKVIAAILVFLLPTLVAFIMKLVGNDAVWSEYSKCISRPSQCGARLWSK